MKKYHVELNFFAKQLRKRRLELDITQEKMAELIDCHVNSFGRMERAKQFPSFKMIMKIAKIFKISPKELMPD